MDDKQVLQRGTNVSIDSKGKRTTRPFTDTEAQDAEDNKSTASRAARSATGYDALLALPSRRDAEIEKATRGYSSGGMVRRGYGKARGA